MSKGKGATRDKLCLCQKQQLKKLQKDEYLILKELCRCSKNMFNVAMYNIRQYFFTEGKYLKYESNYHLCKDNENYRMLNSNMAQQILKEADGAFKSFFGLLRVAKGGKYDYRSIRLPKYLSMDGYYTLVIGQVRIKEDMTFDLPMSYAFRKLHETITLNVPENLRGRKVKELRIIPKSNARYFEVQYTYEVAESERELDKAKALAVDIGLDNLAACVTTEGGAFIVDGKRLKAVNQFFNKTNSKLQSIKDIQGIEKTTKGQAKLWNKRNNKVGDYIKKSARYIVNYCLSNDIGTIIVGYNPTLQRNINLGRVSNQNFVNIPIGKFRETLEYLCRMENIRFLEVEESYTSKSDFFSNDILPVYNADNPRSYGFLGRRITRGQYRSLSGKVYNADCNGALNILRKGSAKLKCKLIEDAIILLQGRGELDTPIRVRIA